MIQQCLYNSFKSPEIERLFFSNDVSCCVFNVVYNIELSTFLGSLKWANNRMEIGQSSKINEESMSAVFSQNKRV